MAETIGYAFGKLYRRLYNRKRHLRFIVSIALLLFAAGGFWAVDAARAIEIQPDFTVEEGGSCVLKDPGGKLEAEKTYVLYSEPYDGWLKLDGEYLLDYNNDGASFTKADVENGLLVYEHDGS
ncbi:MAG: hypothetical protein ACQERN_13425, partial [Thermodesulfobacteriota bacterium]